MFEIVTKHGTIHYEDNIIRTIVNRGVEASDDRVLLYNNSRRLVSLPGRVQAGSLPTGGSNTIKVTNDEEEGLQITVYIVVRFGTSISEATNNLIDYIYENTEKITKVRPQRVTVHVTGVLSKNLVRREIEVSRP